MYRWADHHRSATPGEGTHVVIAGFQWGGSLGRRLVEGAAEVRVLGTMVPVRATIHTLGGFSAHAGRSELLAWGGTMRGSRPRVLLNHGEDAPRQSLAAALRADFAWDPALPGYGQEIDLDAGR